MSVTAVSRCSWGCHHAEAREIAGEGDYLQEPSADLCETGAEGSGFLEFGTDLQSPDFAKIAEGSGFWIDSEDAGPGRADDWRKP